MIKACQKLNNVFKLSDNHCLKLLNLITFERSALLDAACVGTGAVMVGIGSTGSFFIRAA